ncbi:DNA-binding response regulator [Amycolatopsis balhimycina DSM 5908]|uniref:DNA-binding response regulator n=1 Tax=Amycolatopsis balhimycina DSM 5908 TaxID=1081091 RepID=A0A428VUK7_AMYBA|nr:response regulator transcription factor [Amycolatopsis balhimycina]RSM34511.1 DNA-binding response regulator [Amycolatopsis balhimycina DSM 5908]
MRLLVLEDDPQLGTEIAGGLRSAGYAVDLVATIADADLSVTVNRYDCLVVDRSLPDGDGLELVRRLRASASRVPVLVLTAMDAVVDRVTGFAEGADDYLVKPFAFAELAARVGALCRRADQPRPPVLRAGGLEVDTARKRVRRDGVLLSVGAKEFAVLELLMIRAGQVVSRTDLIEHCWDEQADPMSNVVDAVIAQLRRKLGPTVISTVRGAGYLVDGPAA